MQPLDEDQSQWAFRLCRIGTGSVATRMPSPVATSTLNSHVRLGLHAAFDIFKRLLSLAPPAPQAHSKAKSPVFREHRHFKYAGDWVIAGYRNDDTNETYYSEGRGIQNEQGVWWYPRDKLQSAERALQTVMVAAAIRRERVAGGSHNDQAPRYASGVYVALSSKSTTLSAGDGATGDRQHAQEDMLPLLREPTWLLPQVPRRGRAPIPRCRFWDRSSTCRRKMCKSLHVQSLWAQS